MEANHILDMADWQTPIGVLENYDNEDTNIMYKETHLCGTPCCFAGYIAVSPEFQKEGGAVSPIGAPVLADNKGESAIEYWLGITENQSKSLCGMSNVGDAYPYRQCSAVVCNIEFPDVITALTSLRDTGLLPGE